MSEPGEGSVSRTALLVRDLPIDERPRERLLQNGSASLSDSELLSILIRSGRPGASSIDVARELLGHFGGLVGLTGLVPEELLRPGIGPAKAATVLAAFELARRWSRAELPDRQPMNAPGAIARYLDLRYGTTHQEIMGALYLDGRNRLIAEQDIFRGTLNRAAVEPRGILKHGLLRDSAGIVVFHTHPSGDPSPSAEDIAFTRRLAEAGETVGVRLVDHLIVGSGGRWVSLRRNGTL